MPHRTLSRRKRVRTLDSCGTRLTAHSVQLTGRPRKHRPQRPFLPCAADALRYAVVEVRPALGLSTGDHGDEAEHSIYRWIVRDFAILCTRDGWCRPADILCIPALAPRSSSSQWSQSAPHETDFSWTHLSSMLCARIIGDTRQCAQGGLRSM